MEIKKIKKLKINKNQITVLIAGIFIGILIFATVGGISSIGSATGAATAVDYVNENFLIPQGLIGEVISTEKKDGFTEINLELISLDGEFVQQVPIFVSKSGKYLVLGELIDLKATESMYNENTYQTGAEIPKRENPEIHMYVMSFCPFTAEAETALKPVAELLKNHVKIVPKFIVNINGNNVDSLRGDVEVGENYRQVCIWKHFEDKWWNYATYINEKCSINNIDTCWKEAANSLGISIDKIEKCVDEEAFEIIKEHYELTTARKVSGSPTILINEVPYTGARTPEDFKRSICSAFESAPEICSDVLSSQGPASAGGC